MISVVAEKYIQIPSEGLRTKILRDVSFYLVGYVSLAYAMLLQIIKITRLICN